MSEKYPPAIEIKDTQSMENIHWEDCVLLLRIGRGEVQTGVYKRDQQYFIRLLSHDLNPAVEEKDLVSVIKEILSENKISSERCREARVIINTPLYTAVPGPLYEENMKEYYYSFLHGKDKNRELQTDWIAEHDLRLIYAVNKSLLNFFKNDFQHFSIFHEQTFLLRDAKHSEGQEPVMYVSLHAGYISVIVFQAGKPALIQSYKTKEPLDVVYHILNIKECLRLKDDTLLYLTGFKDKSEFFVEKLQHGFEQITHLERPKTGQFPASAEKYPSHYFYHLVSLALCESLAENTEAEG